MSMYAVIQGTNAGKFFIIRGRRSPAGYPVGIEDKDWSRTRYVNLNIDEARKIADRLNSQTLRGTDIPLESAVINSRDYLECCNPGKSDLVSDQDILTVLEEFDGFSCDKVDQQLETLLQIRIAQHNEAVRELT